jgi:hypothetical protein
MISIVQEYGERKTRWTLEITSGQIPPTCLEAFIADLRKAARTVETLNRSEHHLDTGHPNPETLCTCGHEQDEHKPVGGCGAYNITAGRELHCRCDIFERQEWA